LRRDLPEGDPRFTPRPIGLMPPEVLAALGEEEFNRLAAGTALARAGWHGLRRNAVLALGAARRSDARALLERLSADSSPTVAEAARWSLARLN